MSSIDCEFLRWKSHLARSSPIQLDWPASEQPGSSHLQCWVLQLQLHATAPGFRWALGMPTQVLMLAYQALSNVLPPTPTRVLDLKREMNFLRVLRCRWLRVGTGDRLKIAEAGSFLAGKKEIGTWVLWPPQRTEFPSSLSEPALEPGEHVTVNLLCDSNLQNYNTANVYCLKPLKMLLIWWSNNTELTKRQLRYIQGENGLKKAGIEMCPIFLGWLRIWQALWKQQIPIFVHLFKKDQILNSLCCSLVKVWREE